ncbi:MAG: hypothetical protein A4C66_11800 [Nitrospira sp. HN-bin3]|uniref:anti-sigma factor family protein n=1 Tax=Nitrospira cf. moscoviensis SBR1015 TaxID=96242 RepID=UPI000A09C124|nr:zf-HC2 domain-containing protein [Nitrospira cf. moscoviensis SBR1015]OQW38375.1 MAG: hypothetical protein A4C66_11800 [Nitrospira sp. HN-bin3]
MAQEEGQRIDPEITCHEVVQWASAYLDDHVGDERKRQIALHLAICAGCETYMKQIAMVRDLMGMLPRERDVSPDLQRLQRAFGERSRRP